jgi:hypothetical protein
MKPIPNTVCLGLLALNALAHAAETPVPYRAPRLPDGHVDTQGIWKNSNLTPLERYQEFAQLMITVADAKRLEVQYYLDFGGLNKPNDPGLTLEARSLARAIFFWCLRKPR